MADDRTTVIYHGFNSFKLDEEEGNRVAVKIDYNSKTKLDKKEASRIRDLLKEYFETLFDPETMNIFDIIASIRKITQDLDEKKLDITVHRLGSGEYVFFKNGMISESGAYKEIYDDEIIVYSGISGVEIKYKNEELQLTSVEQVERVKSDLADLVNTVVSLNQMTKQNAVQKNYQRNLRPKPLV